MRSPQLSCGCWALCLLLLPEPCSTSCSWEHRPTDINQQRATCLYTLRSFPSFRIMGIAFFNSSVLNGTGRPVKFKCLIGDDFLEPSVLFFQSPKLRIDFFVTGLETVLTFLKVFSLPVTQNRIRKVILPGRLCWAFPLGLLQNTVLLFRGKLTS